MRSTGIRRKVDDLGRVVIPAGVRRSLGIREGDALEVCVEGDQVILAKPRDRCVFCGSEDEPLQSFRGRVVCRSCVASVAVLDDRLDGRTDATDEAAEQAPATPDPAPAADRQPAAAPAAAPMPAPARAPAAAVPAPPAEPGPADERARVIDERRQHDLAALERERQSDYDPASTTAW